MLTIRRITLENFMPYAGRCEIDLGTTTQPIIIIHGNNMAGKTSLFSAIRWALYGEALDRFGMPMQPHLLLNKTAERQQEFQMSVTLDISVTDEANRDEPALDYRVQRVARGKKKPGAEHLDFDVSLLLHNDELGTQGDDQARIQVENLLPKDISRFFFFDGEMLNEYEELVRQGGDHAKMKVRQAIESILGLPALTLTTGDIQYVREKIQSEISKVAKEQQSLTKVRDQYNEAEETLKSRLADEAALKKQGEPLVNESLELELARR